MFGFLKKYTFFPTLSREDFLVLGAGLGIFVGLATSTIDKFSIWFDEAFGSYLIRFDFWHIATYTAHDVHPPLYYWALKVWSLLFGNTEIGLRSMSIFFGAMTVVFVFLIVLRLWGRRTAYAALLLLIISPVFIRYSQEARMYTMLTAEIVAATYMLIYAQHSKKRWPWVAYGVLIAAGMWTQYMAALAWIAHWAWRFWEVRKPGESLKKTVKKVCGKQWLQAYGLAVLLFLPWLPFLAFQFSVVQGFGFWIGPVTSTTVPDFLTDALVFTDAGGVQSWLAAGFYLLLVSFGYIMYRQLRELKGDERRNYMLVLFMIVTPIILLVAASMPPLRSAFVDRYLLPSVVFMSILFAIGLTSRPKVNAKLRTVTGVILVVVLIVGVVNQTVIGNYNKANHTANMARQIVETARASNPNIPIVAATPWTFYEAVIYNKPSSPIYFVAETTKYEFGSLRMLKDDDTFKIKDLDAFTAAHPQFWYVGTIDGNDLTPLRHSWQPVEKLKVNDYLTGKPILEAMRISAE